MVKIWTFSQRVCLCQHVHTVYQNFMFLKNLTLKEVLLGLQRPTEMKSKVIQKHGNSRSEGISGRHLVQSPLKAEVTESSSGLSLSDFQVFSRAGTLYAFWAACTLNVKRKKNPNLVFNFTCCNFAFFNHVLKKNKKTSHHLLWSKAGLSTC